jgi:hypothetical protein
MELKGENVDLIGFRRYKVRYKLGEKGGKRCD